MDEHAWGIQRSYLNHAGERVESPEESVAAVLEALGAHDAPPEPATRVVEAAATYDAGNIAAVEMEGGGEAEPGAPLPLGYHRARTVDGVERLLIATPRECYFPEDMRTWGWMVQLYSVRSEDSWGMGDLGDLARLGAWARSRGAGACGVNPLHAPLAVESQQASPYFPSSRVFRNPLYIRISDVPGGGDLEEPDARALNGSELIERDAIYALKMRSLRSLWDRFDGSPSFDRYRAETGPLLEDYATFAALCETHQGGPSAWPESLASGGREFERWREANRDVVGYHAWMQWLLDEQLARAGDAIDLVQDLAIGVDPDGADAWLWRDLFVPGFSIGSPPDEFNTRGQNWGLPPLDPWKTRAAGYEPFVQTLRAGFRHAKGLRIDHVLGLFRLFWIPEGASPAEGVYVHYPYEDLLAIVALESVRARAFVIGEDLGTFEPIVHEQMSARRLLGYKLMWFEDDPPEEWPSMTLGAVTNHDLPTVAGMWTGADLDEQRALELEPNDGAMKTARDRLGTVAGIGSDAPVDDVIVGAHRALARAPSAIIFATLEDACAAVRRPNQPGTTDDQRPNWSLPLPCSLEQLMDLERAEKIAAALGGPGISAAPGR